VHRRPISRFPKPKGTVIPGALKIFSQASIKLIRANKPYHEKGGNQRKRIFWRVTSLFNLLVLNTWTIYKNQTWTYIIRWRVGETTINDNTKAKSKRVYPWGFRIPVTMNRSTFLSLPVSIHRNRFCSWLLHLDLTPWQKWTAHYELQTEYAFYSFFSIGGNCNNLHFVFFPSGNFW